MAAQYSIATAADETFPHPVRPRVVARVTLCLLVAMIEGAAAAGTLFGLAFGYHLLILGTEVGDFYWPLYIATSVLVGAVYGTSSAVVCSRFLEGQRQLGASMGAAFWGWTWAVALMLLVAFLAGEAGELSRVSLTTAYLVGIPALLALRNIIQAVLLAQIARGALQYVRVSVIGKRADVVDFLVRGDLWRHGHKLTGTLYLEDATLEDGEIDAERVRSFGQLSSRLATDHMLLVGRPHDFDAIEGLVAELKRFAINVLYVPQLRSKSFNFLDVLSIGSATALLCLRKPLTDMEVLLKRAMDIAAAVSGLILLSPLFLIVALAIKLESRGPVFFRQERRGFNGESFMILKFRTMRVMELGSAMRQAERRDPRITRIGRFLRATSIDELPQLLNVLLGQMSIVGPRPHAISHDDELGLKLETYAHRQRIKPGITGWAQVNGFRGATVTFEQIEGRTIHDLYYVENWSLFFDIWIVALTVFSPISHRNAH